MYLPWIPASAVRTHMAALRLFLGCTAVLGLAYPLLVLGIGRIPGLAGRADGSLLRDDSGRVVGSSLLGQRFDGAGGAPLARYFQPRPSVSGYDGVASGASNLGPEDVVDRTRASLLTRVCRRSLEVARRDGTDPRRPYCTPDGVGAVLAVFHTHGTTGPVTRAVSLNQRCPATPFRATYQGVRVECAQPGVDYSHGVVTPVRGPAAPAAVPADAVTASASGLDPHVSPAYARLQVPRVARARHLPESAVRRLVKSNTQGRLLGFLGEPRVNVVRLNLALDRMSR